MAIKQIIPATGVVAYLTDQRRLPVIAWALHDDDDRVTGLVIAWGRRFRLQRRSL